MGGSQQLADAAARLAVTDEDRAKVTAALVGLLVEDTDSRRARLLADSIAGLDPAAEDRERARAALIESAR